MYFNFYFLFKPIFAFLNNDELEISFELIKEFKIRHCIMVGNPTKMNEIIFNVKTFSWANIPVSFLSYEHLTEFIDTKFGSSLKIGLIFNEENLHRLGQTTQTLKEVNQIA